MDLINKINDIDYWVRRTFTSAHVAKSLDERSHLYKCVVTHSEYMVIIIYNYKFDFVNGLVSLRSIDPSTGKFIKEEYEAVTVSQFKKLVIDYLEANKDKVKCAPDDDETLISHIDFRKSSESSVIDNVSNDHIDKIDNLVHEIFKNFHLHKELNVCRDGNAMIWQLTSPYADAAIGYVLNTHTVSFHIVINSKSYKGRDIEDYFMEVPFDKGIDNIINMVIVYEDDIEESKKYMMSKLNDNDIETNKSNDDDQTSEFNVIDFINDITGED